MNLFATPHQKSQQMSFDNAVAVSKYLNRKKRKSEKAEMKQHFKNNQLERLDPRELAIENQELYGA